MGIMAKKKASNTVNGKAFEYACLNALRKRLQFHNVQVIEAASKALATAEKAYDTIEQEERINLDNAAETAVSLLVPLEPKLMYGSGTLLLKIAADAAAIGVDGDVRDVLCVRSEEGADGWTIGMSCKHNHEALRHPRITEKKDFGADWIGIHCSRAFMEEITPVTDSLISYGENKVLWRNGDRKWDRDYVPILSAYMKEIQCLCSAYENVPEKLLSYFFGANDFYKIIMKTSARTTTIEGFNMHGTLNQSAGKKKAMTRVPVVKMPTRLIDAAFKTTSSGPSKTTIILTFDGGWAISMRLHNKDDIAKPTSLAWDVKLEGLPPSTYVNTHSWDE